MRVRLLFAALAVTLSLGAWANEVAQPAAAPAATKTYAALSLISDALEIVSYRGETGSHLATTVNRVALPQPVYDTTALLAVREVFEKQGTEKPLVLLRSSEKLYAQQKELFSGGKFNAVAGLDTVFSSNKITHLVVVSKVRQNAVLKLADVSVGSGKLEGLGFYLDFKLPTERTSGTFDKAIGFLAPYTYFKVSLVDVSTSTVTKEVEVTASRVLSSSATEGISDPWSTLTPAEKDKMLKDMIRKEVVNAVSSLL